LWIIPIAGGEPRQVTFLPGGAFEHSWSPDSEKIAFVSDVNPDEAAESVSNRNSPVREVHRIRFRADGYGWRGDAFRHIFAYHLGSGGIRQLTYGEGDDHSPIWSPDGQNIALIAENRDSRDMTHFTEAWIVSKSGGKPEIRSDGLFAVGAVTWSPNSVNLAVVGDSDPEMWDPRQWKLYVLNRSGPPRQITDGLTVPTLPAPDLRWTMDDLILFLGDSKGESFICRVPVAGGPIEAIAGGGVKIEGMTLDFPPKNAIVNVIPPHSLGDLSRVDLHDGAMNQVTNYNKDYFDNHPPATMTKFMISRTGFEIESRLLTPPGFDPSIQYPLILDIHGGPQGRFSDSFNVDHQILATAGYLVLGVNPRGSSSYGHGFARAVHQDWGGEDYRDIMAAVDEVCSRDYVDETRLGIGGYSYGGYMSAWIVGQDTRFRAAVVGAPCINLVSFYGTSDIGVSFGESQFGGPPCQNMASLVQRSPLTYVANVETPVLLLHGEIDATCPISQSEEYFVSLKRLGKTVEFVRFPECAHSFRSRGAPEMRREYLKRTKDWFDRFVK
jgi:dipeptidyl aminopeptidase/acylaminoacyl peptidase